MLYVILIWLGNFVLDAEVQQTSFEDEEENLEGGEKISFLKFIRKILQ